MVNSPNPTIFCDNGSEYVADACMPFEHALADGTISGGAWSRGQYPGMRLKSGQIAGISTIGYWDADKDQNWFVPPHYNEGIEISIVLNGAVNFETDTTSEILTRGQVALTSPWQRHSHGRPVITASKLIWIVLDVGMRRPNSKWSWPDWILATDKEKSALAKNIRHNKFPVFTASADMLLAFERIYDLLSSSIPSAGCTTMSIYLNLVINSLADMMMTHRHHKNRGELSDSHLTVQLFLKGLESHLPHAWRLEEMARQCGVSRSQLTTLCQELTNKSPIEYLNDLRLNAAAKALEFNPEKSITDICFEYGFGSSQYFSRRFSDYFGASPRDYRNEKNGGAFHRKHTGENYRVKENVLAERQ